MAMFTGTGLNRALYRYTHKDYSIGTHNLRESITYSTNDNKIYTYVWALSSGT